MARIVSRGYDRVHKLATALRLRYEGRIDVSEDRIVFIVSWNKDKLTYGAALKINFGSGEYVISDVYSGSEYRFSYVSDWVVVLVDMDEGKAVVYDRNLNKIGEVSITKPPENIEYYSLAFTVPVAPGEKYTAYLDVDWVALKTDIIRYIETSEETTISSGRGAPVIAEEYAEVNTVIATDAPSGNIVSETSSVTELSGSEEEQGLSESSILEYITKTEEEQEINESSSIEYLTKSEEEQGINESSAVTYVEKREGEQGLSESSSIE